MRCLHDKPHVILTWEIAPQLPRLRTDPVQLKSVLKNLIDNAMKFTQTGSVTVRLAPCNDGVEMVVADTGIGMTPDTLAVVFEPFRQGDSSPTRRHGGVGLGLYIVRRVIEALGGTIKVRSEVGHGTTFQVWVPVGIKT
jgi:signal transduction histidine kinase